MQIGSRTFFKKDLPDACISIIFEYHFIGFSISWFYRAGWIVLIF